MAKTLDEENTMTFIHVKNKRVPNAFKIVEDMGKYEAKNIKCIATIQIRDSIYVQMNERDESIHVQAKN
jgi:uncharacterized protein YaaQ